MVVMRLTNLALFVSLVLPDYARVFGKIFCRKKS